MRSGARSHPLTCLIVGTDEWAIEQGALSLEMAGHVVARCHEPGAPVFPCRALQPGGQCPLDAGVGERTVHLPHALALDVAVRPDTIPLPAEIGVVCALHAGVPLVVAGLATDHPFAPWAAATVDPTGDLADACVTVAARRTVDLTDLEPAGGDVATVDRSITG